MSCESLVVVCPVCRGARRIVLSDGEGAACDHCDAWGHVAAGFLCGVRAPRKRAAEPAKPAPAQLELGGGFARPFRRP